MAVSCFRVAPAASSRPNSRFLFWKSTISMFIRLMLPKVKSIPAAMYSAFIGALYR